MTHKTQPTAHAEITAPISADLRRMSGDEQPEALQQSAQPDALAEVSKEQYARMFNAACEALGQISDHLGIDSDIDPGAEPIIEAIDELRAAALQAAPPAPAAVAVPEDLEQIRVGRLPTMNQDEYPGLGDWWVQLRIGSDGNEVLARVYGNSPEQASARAEALAAAPAQPAAWMTPEGDRVVTEATMASARKDGGAMLSSLRPFTVALARAAAPAQAVAMPAPKPVATIEVQDDGSLDYETSDAGWLLPAGLHKLYTAPAQEHATQLAGQALPADEFRGDTASLVRNITALLDLDAQGCLVPHGVGGHARGLLSAAASRLAAPALEAPAAPADLTMTPAEIDSISSAWIYPGQQVGLASVREIVQAVLRRLRGVAEIRASVASRALAAAPQAPAAPAVDARAERDAAFEAVRNRLCGLQRYSFVLDDDGVVRRAQDRSGNWIEFDEAHELLDPVAVDAAIVAQAKEGAQP